MKILRNILAVPVVFVTIGLIYYLIGYLSSLLPKDTFWLLVIVFIFGNSIAMGIYQLSALFMALVSRIATNKMVGFWSCFIASILFAVFQIIAIWSHDFDYSGKIIFLGILITLFYIVLTFSFIAGASTVLDD